MPRITSPKLAPRDPFFLRVALLFGGLLLLGLARLYLLPDQLAPLLGYGLLELVNEHVDWLKKPSPVDGFLYGSGCFLAALLCATALLMHFVPNLLRTEKHPGLWSTHRRTVVDLKAAREDLLGPPPS